MTKLCEETLERIWTDHDVQEKLVHHYTGKIIEAHADLIMNPDNEWVQRGNDDGNSYEITYLGTIMSIMPSGKYYVQGLTSHQGMRDMLQDGCFSEAMSNILCKYDMWLETGEGCPTDLFLCRPVKIEVKNDEK